MDDWRSRIADCGDQSLSTALIGAIEELFTRDAHLLCVDVHENTIAAMLRCYLQPRVGNAPSDGVYWDVDFDYNRRMATVKTIHGVQKVRPDLIVHRRNTDYNHLAIELKKGASDEPDAVDIMHLKAYRQPLEALGLGYRHALFLRFGVGEDAGTVSCVQWV
ncbi:hypothetical protein [Paraburkholderia tropica]|uniref:hypothetical protein n=1 Tax=Paraburkholderia tropica TaxID=92647 RepID=UPI001F16848B|nr:hypothetical protein [Paraburkholderia tropica]